MSRHASKDSPPRNQGVPWSEADVLRAIELRESYGLTWPEVGQRIGRSAQSIASTVCAYRAGRKKFRLTGWNAQLEEIVEEILQGSTMKAAADKRGRCPSSVHMSLGRIGWDMKLLIEARKERQSSKQERIAA